jgi:hypothetical protein
MIILLLLLFIAAVLSIRLYSEAGESICLFILVMLGVAQPPVGRIVAPSIILYYGMRRLLV